MSDTQDAPLLRVADSDAPPAAVPAAVQAGALLRGYREKARYEIAALAAVVKVPVRRLEALEAGALDTMPEPVYVRALVVGICRVLKADPQPVLALLPAGLTQPFKQDAGMDAVEFSSGGAAKVYGLREWMSRPHFGWALVFVLGSVLLYGFPEIASWWSRSAASPDVLEVVRPLVSADPPPQAVDPQPVEPPALPAAQRFPEPIASPDVAGSGVAATALPGPLGTDVLELKAHGRTWVEVLDAKGLVVLRRHLEDGERVGAKGLPPLAVVVGRADVTEVWVRGKVMDIKPISQDNVARFEVK